jgi:hypothetical protein
MRKPKQLAVYYAFTHEHIKYTANFLRFALFHQTTKTDYLNVISEIEGV